MTDEGTLPHQPALPGTSARGPLIAAVGCAIVAAILAAQGWQRGFSGIEYDQVINIDEAHKLVDQGRLPQVGALASFGAYNPPGTAWLIAPGLLTDNPRLYERVGAAVISMITLVGLWLLTRTCADARTAALVVALYALSSLGLYFAYSLWPRAKPGAFIWMTYFLVLWATRRDARFLAAAVVTFAAGMYIFFEMAPAALSFVLVWLVYRPPVRIGSLLVALVVSVIIWWPHLAFERTRHFSDIRHQMLLDSVAPDANKLLASYGDALGSWDADGDQLGPFAPQVQELPKGSLAARAKSLFFHAFYFVRNLFSLFWYQNPAGIAAVPIFCLPLVAFFTRAGRLPERLRAWRGLTYVGVALLVAAAAANPVVAGRVQGRSLDRSESLKVVLVEAVIAAAGIALVARHTTARALERFAPAGISASASTTKALPFDVLLVCLVGPWVATSLLATFAKYGWWLWGVQTVVLGAAASYIPRQRGWGRLSVVAFEVLVLATVIFNTVTLGRLRDWRHEGFAGERPQLVAAVDRMADDIRTNPLPPDTMPTAAIGYLLFFNGYEILDHEIDARYKIGGPLDQYLDELYGIANTRSNAEGFTADDSYRVVEVSPRPNKLHRFRFADAEQFELIEGFGSYELWKRKEVTSKK